MSICDDGEVATRHRQSLANAESTRAISTMFVSASRTLSMLSAPAALELRHCGPSPPESDAGPNHCPQDRDSDSPSLRLRRG